MGPRAKTRQIAMLKARLHSLVAKAETDEEFADGFRDFPTATRKRMAKAGTAMADGSFPIGNCDDAKQREAGDRENVALEASVGGAAYREA